MDSDKKIERPPHPRATANIFSVLTFSWTRELFFKGFKRDLETNDLYATLQDHSSSALGDMLQRHWNTELKNSSMSKRSPSLLRALVKMFGFKMMVYGIVLAVIEIIMSFAVPYCIQLIVGYFTHDESITFTDGCIAAASLVILSAVARIIMHWEFFGVVLSAMKMRVATGSIVYKKALRLSRTALGETTAGQVVNLLSNDVNRFDIAVIFLHYLWIGPLETIVVTYFLWLEIDACSLIGVAVLLAFIPLQGWLGKKTSSLRLKTAIRTDERVRLMNEIIAGIQVIKMYTWELPFAKLVQQARRKEIEVIRGTSYIRGVLLSFIIFHARIAMFFSIFSYVITGHQITAQKVFVITSYFNILRQTMTVFFPQGIGQVAEALVSIRRLQKFLLYEENELYANTAFTNGLNLQKEKDATPIYRKFSNQLDINQKEHNCDSNDEYCIILKNASAKWSTDAMENSLNNITLNVLKGKLIAVIGPVGAGKSSLLQAVLRELPLASGSINISGTMSYASQEPWLFAGSVRQNILFGLPMDRDRYREVVDVCALKADFKQFAYGDKTIVGERGVSLSGGQRARVNLARAVYKQADIYLLDDPLSAVDTHVGKHLFEDCISRYLKNKTVILVTHQLQYLNNADHIILLEQGSILGEGNYEKLQESGLDFTNLLSHRETKDENNIEDSIDASEYKPSRSRKISIQSVASSLEDTGLGDKNPQQVDETRSLGNVGFYVYRSYFAAGGNCCFVFFMFMTCILAQLLASGSDAWITYWVNLEEHVFSRIYKNGSYTGFPENNSSSAVRNIPVLYTDRRWSIYIFAIITFSMVIVTLIRSFAFVEMCMNASMKLHNYMFDGITRATMRFFNTNPSGRILNRFSKDVGSIDEILPMALIDCLQIGLTLLGIVTVVAFVNFWLLIPTVVIAILFYFLRQFYVSTSRSVKRLEGVTRSPVFSHLNASLQGLVTIRAFGAQTILEKEFDNHQDLHSSAWYLFLASSRAFGFWLDMVCVIYIAMVTFSFLLISEGAAVHVVFVLFLAMSFYKSIQNHIVQQNSLHKEAFQPINYIHSLKNKIQISSATLESMSRKLITASLKRFKQDTFGGNVGLAITQAIGLTGMFQWGMRQSAELENQMTSVERVLEYGKVPSEAYLESPPDKKPATTWPDKGQIVFKNMFLKYEQNGSYILQNLNFVIKPEEKVGIVGRTGAGKSSLIAAIFRLADNEGKIIIDGIDINTIGLHEVRSKISIIPQEPVLFSGTMRKNLDPFDEYPDHVLWSALEEVELKEAVNDLAGGLNSKMSEGGSNFSVGQRQLVCLARAIVRNNKILVLDEATANVDPQTDILIQSTIREKFLRCTVLTIAHRLNTVMDSDKVLVMDAGTCVEFDHPYILLKKPNGFLSKMVGNVGKTTSDHLYSVAAESYERFRNKRIPHIDEDVLDADSIQQAKKEQ